MKSSKEIADTVFKIRDEYLEKKRKRNIMIKTITSCCSAACLCAIVLVCAKNMQLPDVDDWIAPSSEPSDFETSQDGTTIKVVTSENTSELQATETTPEASASTDVREQSTEHTDNKNTTTTVRSGDDGNNTKTTKPPGSQNTVTTHRPAGSSVNNTKTTKRPGSQNTVTTRKPAGSSVNNTKTTKHTSNQNNTITKKTTLEEGMSPNVTSKPTGSPDIVTTHKFTTAIYTKDPVTPVTSVTVIFVTEPVTVTHTLTTTIFLTKPPTETNIKPETTIWVVTSEQPATTKHLTTEVAGTIPPPLSGETQLVERFSEIYYNGNSYQTNNEESGGDTIDSGSIESYIDDITLWDDNNYAIIADVYKINNVSVNDAVAIKFRGYNTYFYYRRRW